MKNKNKLIALLLSSAFIMLILGCTFTTSDDSGDDDTGPATGPAIASTAADTYVEPEEDTITLTFEEPVEAATGVDLKEEVEVYSDDTDNPTTVVEVTSVVLSPSPEVTSSSQITITVADSFKVNEKVKVVIAKDTLIDSSGNTNTEALISEAIFVAHNLADYSLSYGSAALAATAETAATFATTANDIPAAASATYTIAAKDGTTDITGITMDGSSIKATIAAGTYELVVTAATEASGYKGSKIADVTLVVSSADAGELTTTVTYENITATYNTEILKTAAIAPTLSAATETVTYSVDSSKALPKGLQVDSTTGKIYGTPLMATESAEYTIIAAGYGNYKGTKEGKITIVVAAATIPADTNFIYNAISGTVDIALAATVGPKWTNKPAGIALTYTIAPTILGGLTLKPSNGEISGTPTAVIEGLDYTITATASGNYTGSKTAKFKITIATSTTNAAALSGTLTYANITGTEGTELTAAVSPTWSVADQTASYAISPTLDGTGLSFSTTTGAISGTPTAVIAGAEYTVTAKGTGNFTGEITSAKFTITIESGVINLNTFNLSYDTAASAVFGTEKTYAVTTTIPSAASATYEVVAKTGSTTIDITGISISADGATITVATTTSAGTYELTVTASTAVDGYTGNKTADVSIIVDPKSIDGYTLSYDTAANAVFGTEKTYAITTTIPGAASATYEVAAKTGSTTTDIAGISIGETDAAITVATTVAVGTYELTVTALATAANYTSTKTADLTITVEKPDLPDFSYVNDGKIASGAIGTLALETGAPSGDGITYAIVAKTIGTGTHTPPEIDAATGEVSIDASTTAGTYKVTVTTASSPAYNDGTKDVLVYVTVHPIDANESTRKIKLIAMVDEGLAAFGDEADLNYIDVLGVKYLSSVFYDKSSFNGDISKWDTSEATFFSNMFGSSSLGKFNGDITKWNVSSATHMDGMFANASEFNQDISGWDMQNVVNTQTMFQNAFNFNQDISGWNLEEVVHAKYMFERADAFNQDISNWKLKKATNLQYMFLGRNSTSGKHAFNNGDNPSGLDAWAEHIPGTPNITDMFKWSSVLDTSLPCWATNTGADGTGGTYSTTGCTSD